MDWTDYLRFLFALIFVIALMGGFWLVLKKLGLSGPIVAVGQRRLKILEIMPIDSRHRAVLLKRDDTEHLVILGPTSETVIETRINQSCDASEKSS